MSINQNTDTLISIGDLLKKHNSEKKRFFIPAYQRGYRWTKRHVDYLINDIFEFKSYLEENQGGPDEFFCLQPLVTKMVDETKYPSFKGYIEVIDGQQRLTTILLILQAIHGLIRKKDPDEDDSITLFPRRYEIKYETRKSSEEWLEKIKDLTSMDCSEAQNIINDNCDYYHLVEAFICAYGKFESMEYDELKNFRDFLYKSVKFIPYEPQLTNVSNNDIFNDINAGKIELNNAELIKALLVQDSNLKNHEKDEPKINTIALKWDEVEITLQNKEFWGFIYSPNHPYTYDTRIEYLLDLIYKKSKENKDYEYFTFDQVNRKYVTYTDKLAFTEDTWGEIKNLYDTLVEWYNNRPLYHRIGYLLEFSKDETILTLRERLKGQKKDAQIHSLNQLINESLSSVSCYNLFHGNRELTQILFLYNVMAEDKRIGSNARFSFADYKNVKQEKNGWDQEHIASNTDYKIKKDDRRKFAGDMFEYFTGEEYSDDFEPTDIDKFVESLEESEKHILNRLIEAANAEDYSEDELTSLFNDILELFKTSSDGFNDTAVTEKGTVSEKNFIWNFALLNASTNRSYGNSLFPVKRKRILNDEYKVYTPVGTRNVFEKAYSRKLTNMMAWTREDALAYWYEICKVLAPFINLRLPFNK